MSADNCNILKTLLSKKLLSSIASSLLDQVRTIHCCRKGNNRQACVRAISRQKSWKEPLQRQGLPQKKVELRGPKAETAKRCNGSYGKWWRLQQRGSAATGIPQPAGGCGCDSRGLREQEQWQQEQEGENSGISKQQPQPQGL